MYAVRREIYSIAQTDKNYENKLCVLDIGFRRQYLSLVGFCCFDNRLTLRTAVAIQQFEGNRPLFLAFFFNIYTV
jgi:hypothetical protein